MIRGIRDEHDGMLVVELDAVCPERWREERSSGEGGEEQRILAPWSRGTAVGTSLPDDALE